MNNPNNQLPDKVVEEIKTKARAYAKSHGRKEIGYYALNWEAGATEYATKLHQAQQEKEEERRQRVYLEMENDVITDNYKKAQQEYVAARALLEKFISRHEAGLLPDRFIYNEIKQYLDGKK